MSKDGVYICADLGVNWQGDMRELNLLTEAAITANIDAVKLQWFDEEYLESHPYPLELRNLLKKMCLNMRFVETYCNHAHAIGMDVVVTPFSMRQLQQIPDNIDGIKIRAADCFQIDMIRKAQTFGKPVYVSVPVVNGYFSKPTDVPEGAFFELMTCLMQPNTYMVMCVPKYPPEANELSLHRVADFTGFSSHYPDPSVPLMAATIAVHTQLRKAKRRFYLEAHLTTTKDPLLAEQIPDMGVSLDPNELAALARGVEILEEAI